MAIASLPDTLVDELVAICGEDHVFTGRSALLKPEGLIAGGLER